MKSHSIIKNLKKPDPQAIWAAGLTIIYFFFEEFLFDLPNAKNAVAISNKGASEYAVWLMSLLAGLVFMFFWFLWSLKAKPAVRIVFGVIFTAGVLLQYGYWNSLHRLINSNDIALLGTTTAQTWRTAFDLYFSWWGLLVCLPYIALLVAFHDISTAGWIELGLTIVFIIGVCCLFTWQHYFFSLGTSFTEVIHSLGTYTFFDNKPVSRESVRGIPGTGPDNNIVLIIDEGIRSDHLGINGYSRDTTPYLEKISASGLLYNWGTMSSGGTCSYIANQLLLTGILPASDALEITARAPTIFQYAQARGYKNYYLDAQTDYLWNGLTTHDIQSIQWINTKNLSATPSADLNAANFIRSVVTNSSGNFIVLNKRGVHFMYENAYPPEWNLWGPLPPRQKYRQYPGLVTNPYDNGIRYNVDEFFRTLLPDNSSLKNTIYIYTSDHAQTLFEDGVTWLHCNDTHKEAAVPFMIIGRLVNPVDLKFPAAHFNILPTILDLMDIPATSLSFTYQSSLLDLDKKRHERIFLDGAMKVVNFDP